MDIWLSAFSHPWSEQKPNNGFMICDSETIVGVLGAIYSTQNIDGKKINFCNLTSLSVMPRYRARTMDLFAHCMAQSSHQFTNFTPNQAVERICSLLRFRRIEGGQYLILHRPAMQFWQRPEALPEPEAEAALQGDALKVYRDHRTIPWIERKVFAAGGRSCLIMFKKRSLTRYRLRMASLIHISDPEFYMTHLTAIGAHMAWRHGLVASLVDRRFLPDRPRPAIIRSDPQTRLFKGDLEDSAIPALYSELVALPI